MHYIMMISENPRMIGECDLLIKSIRFFSDKNVDLYFTIVLQGNEDELPKNPFNIKKIEKDNYKKYFNCDISKYLIDTCEFYFSAQKWNLGMPCRWFVEPKAEMCVMIDVDMIACNKLNEFYNLSKNKLYGVKVKNKKILSTEDWGRVGFSKKDIDEYYINFGLVLIPSKYLRKIGLSIFENFNNMAKFHGYHAGQLALAYSIKNLGLKLNLLPNKFNYYDLNEFPGRENILFLHLLENKSAYNQKEVKNKYIKLVKKIKKEMIKVL